MASSPSARKRASWLAYCEAELAKPDLTPERREILSTKAEVYRRSLVNHCVRCGQELLDPQSIEAAKTNGGLGPDCVKALVSA